MLRWYTSTIRNKRNMTQSSSIVIALLVLTIVKHQQLHHVGLVYGFSMSMSMSMNNNNNLSSIMTSDSNNKFDRFKSVCINDKKKKESVIKEFGDESLLSSLGLHSKNNNVDDENDDDNELWAAVYRSNNNKPSVIVRDDFFRAMNDATTTTTTTKSADDDNAMNNVSTISPSNTATFLSDTIPDLLQIPSSKPVAIARLIKTNDNDVYLLDNLRCSLKKEDQDINCDGGSEYLEALSCAVDTLLLNHLQQKLSLSSSSSNTNKNTQDDNDNDDIIFKDGTIRTKATLFNSKLFEQRGFIPIETLSRDMATHVSNYDSCLNSYTERACSGEQSTTTTTNNNSGIGFGQKQKQEQSDDDDVASSNSNNENTTTMMATGTRDRALQIVSLLGRLDPRNIVSDESSDNKTDDKDDDEDEDEYDPWATMYVKR
jgi:hypothetical protein